jgi:hypothetical protein
VDTNLQVEADNGNQVVVQKSAGNVGLRTTTPQNTLHIGAAQVANTLGIRSPVANAAVLGTNANGDIVAKTVEGNCLCGEIKRTAATLPSPWRKLDGIGSYGANTCGLSGLVPNATGAYLVQNGTTLGSVSGSNSKTISRANLPLLALNITTNSAGAHQHFIMTNEDGTNESPDRALTNSFNNNNLARAVRGQFRSITNWTDGAYSVGMSSTTPTLGGTSSDGSHTHTIATIDNLNNTGVQQALDVTPRSLSLDTFVCLN